jgi:ABC-2 type transport system ATP-binding protein
VTGVSDVDVEERRDGYRVRCRVDPEAMAPLLAALAEAGVRTMTSRPPSLEELFLRYYDTGAS